GVREMLDRRLRPREVAKLHAAQPEREELVDVVERAASLHLAPVAALHDEPGAHRGELVLERCRPEAAADLAFEVPGVVLSRGSRGERASHLIEALARLLEAPELQVL